MGISTFDPSAHPDLSSEQASLIRQITLFTEEYFRNPKFDASHDFKHVMRVVRNSVHILDREKSFRAAQSPPLPKLDTSIVILGALLHDVEDKKYVSTPSSEGPLAKRQLMKLGLEEQKASTVQLVVDGVSYSSEMKNPEKVRILIDEIPELAVVQDADRLDAIGAIGIGRCFTFGGAKAIRSLGSSIDHFDEKLLKIETIMKTRTGTLLATERSDRIREFMTWWKEETDFGGPA